MNPEERIIAEAAGILKPIDDLLEREADGLRREAEKIAKQEEKCDEIFPPAERIDEN